MRRSISKRRNILIAAAAAIVVVIVVAIIMVTQSMNTKTDPYKQTETINEAPDTTTTDPVPDSTTDTTPDTTDPANDDTSTLDPATVSTIDVAPVGITVSYVKGVGGFDYLVQRTTNGTRYVEFRNESLAGTKCTGDEGPFASILVDPTTDESATLAKKITVEGTVYGLSLAAATCTSDPGLLKQYQDSFSSAFSLLKKSTTN